MNEDNNTQISRFVLQGYTITLRVAAFVAVLASLVVDGFLLYLWGRVSAAYDLLTAVITQLTKSLAQFGSASGGALQVPQIDLPPLPIWPLLIVLLLVVVGALLLAFSMWAFGDWLDLNLALAKEAQWQSRAQLEVLKSLSSDMAKVANYFAALPGPARK